MDTYGRLARLAAVGWLGREDDELRAGLDEFVVLAASEIGLIL